MGPKGFYLILLLLGLLVLHMEIEEISGFPSGALKIDSAESTPTTAYPLTIDPEVQEFETTTGPFLQQWSPASGSDSLVQKSNIKDNHGLNAKQVVEEATTTGVEDHVEQDSTPAAFLDLLEHAETAGEESEAKLAAFTATGPPSLDANSTEIVGDEANAELEALTATEVPEVDRSSVLTDANSDISSRSEAQESKNMETSTSMKKLQRQTEDPDFDHPENCDDLEHGHEVPQSDPLFPETNSTDTNVAVPSQSDVKHADTETDDPVEQSTAVPPQPEVSQPPVSELQEDFQPDSTIPPETEENPTLAPPLADEANAEIESATPEVSQRSSSEVETTPTPLETIDDTPGPTNTTSEAQEVLAVEAQTTSAPTVDFDTEDTNLSETTVVLVNTTNAPLTPVDLPPPTVETIGSEQVTTTTSQLAPVPVVASTNEAPPTQISIVTSEHVVKVERTASTDKIVSHGSSYAIVPIFNLDMAVTASRHKFNSSDIVPGSVTLEDFTSELNQIFDAVLVQSDGFEGSRYWFLPMRNSVNELTTDATLNKHVIQVIPARNAIHPQAALMRSQQLNLCLQHQGDSQPCIYLPCDVTQMKQQFDLKLLYQSKKISSK